MNDLLFVMRMTEAHNKNQQPKYRDTIKKRSKENGPHDWVAWEFY